MLKHIIRVVVLLVLSLFSANAQMGAPRMPDFSDAFRKVFGENAAYSADVSVKTQINGAEATIPMSMSSDSGNTRMEIDMTQMVSAAMPAEGFAQMKMMGMDKMVIVTLVGEKRILMIYPSLKCYAEMPIPNVSAEKGSADKVDTVVLGTEVVDGHPCEKQKMTVTDSAAQAHVFTLWKAKDMKDFPIKMEMTELGIPVSILFKNVNLTKPAASAFSAPADYTRYTDISQMMQEQVMKRMMRGAY